MTIWYDERNLKLEVNQAKPRMVERYVYKYSDNYLLYQFFDAHVVVQSGTLQ